MVASLSDGVFPNRFPLNVVTPAVVFCPLSLGSSAFAGVIASLLLVLLLPHHSTQHVTAGGAVSADVLLRLLSHVWRVALRSDLRQSTVSSSFLRAKFHLQTCLPSRRLGPFLVSPSGIGRDMLLRKISHRSPQDSASPSRQIST
ncbi:unnamed protein product [Arctogadus glacialis]